LYVSHTELSLRGGDIGTFEGDAIREMQGRIGAAGTGVFNAGKTTTTGVFEPDVAYGYGAQAIPMSFSTNHVFFKASRVVPTDYENRPASLSVLICISY
jgi:hypothetical protein